MDEDTPKLPRPLFSDLYPPVVHDTTEQRVTFNTGSTIDEIYPAMMRNATESINPWHAVISQPRHPFPLLLDQHPFLGRMVHYVHAAGVEYAAVITGIDPEGAAGVVSLHVFADLDGEHKESQMTPVSAIPHSAGEEPGTWHVIAEA